MKNNLNELMNNREPSDTIDFIESLNGVVLTEEQLDFICGLIPEEDKGLRNAISNLLILNNTPLIPFKLVPLISSQDISVRNFTGEILTKKGECAVRPLLDYIKTGNDDDKKFIIDILGIIGNLSASDRIIEFLKTDENANITLACIEALGNLKAETSIPELISIYMNNDLFKPSIVEALGKIGSAEALSFILSKYEEEDELTKFSIIESIGLIGDEESFFFLLAELNDSKGALIWPIIKAIHSLKEKFSFDIPFDERMRNVILQIIFEADNEYRKIASDMLSVFNDKEIISVYLKLFGEDFETDEIISNKIKENPRVFFELIGLFLKDRGSNIKSLLNLLKEITGLYFRQINRLLSSLQLRDIIDSLSGLINDYDEEVRIFAFELLFRFDIKTALLFAEDLCEDPNYWNRLRIIEIIENTELPEIPEILRKLSNDPEEMIRDRAVSSLSNRIINKIYE